MRLGFSTGEHYVIDVNKITKFNFYCNDPLVGYSAIKARLGMDNAHDISIEALKLNGSAVVGSTQLCGPPVTTRLRQQFHTTRPGVLATGEIIMIKTTIIT